MLLQNIKVNGKPVRNSIVMTSHKSGIIFWIDSIHYYSDTKIIINERNEMSLSEFRWFLTENRDNIRNLLYSYCVDDGILRYALIIPSYIDIEFSKLVEDNRYIRMDEDTVDVYDVNEFACWFKDGDLVSLIKCFDIDKSVLYLKLGTGSFAKLMIKDMEKYRVLLGKSTYLRGYNYEYIRY